MRDLIQPLSVNLSMKRRNLVCQHLIINPRIRVEHGFAGEVVFDAAAAGGAHAGAELRVAQQEGEVVGEGVGVAGWAEQAV